MEENLFSSYFPACVRYHTERRRMGRYATRMAHQDVGRPEQDHAAQ
jgi:hypothetical protein